MRRFHFFLFTLLLIVASCGKLSDEDKREVAVEKAYLLMSAGDCAKAISTLESAPSSDTDARYLKTLSQAYACRAGYSTVQLFGSDLTNFGGAGSFLNDLARFSTSTLMTEVDSVNFEDLQHAIDILLYAGGIASTKQPTAARRSLYFTTDDAGEINAQLSYLILVQMGMYFRYFGNMDSTGIKASGGGTNDCLLTYSDADAKAIITGAGGFGACDNPAVDTGNTELMADSDLACRAVVLFNNLTDVLPAVVAAASSDLLSGAWITNIDAAKDALSLAFPGLTLLTEQNYNDCITDHPAYDKDLEVYFASIFESNVL